MALDVEEVVDGRMDGEEPLRGRGRFEPLHLSLSSSHRLMGTSKNDAAGVNPDVPCGLPDSGQV